MLANSMTLGNYFIQMTSNVLHPSDDMGILILQSLTGIR